MKIDEFDFSHYYTYKELVNYLHILGASQPNFLKLAIIGKSHSKRDIWLATVTNQATGSDLKKPAYWIDANTHAGEVTGSAVALYIIYHLITQYESDKRVKRLLDNYTFYILPRLAVDGAEKYLTTPYKLRSSVRKYPKAEPKDGLYPEDINGDNLILQMRIKDRCGAWKVSEKDSRLMIRREPEEFGNTYYTVLTEGLIRNYDGYKIKAAPALEGIDFNRNYPHQWQPEKVQKGAGHFPFSESETRAEAEFWHQHPNINGFISYHTYGGVILRPYSTHSDEHFPSKDLEIYKILGEKGKSITGYDCVSVYHDFRYDPKMVTAGAMDDYAYDRFGWFGFTIELWDLALELGIEKKDYIKWYNQRTEAEDLQLLKWNDELLKGEGFINWKTFQHPQLGEVEIGGWDWKNVWQNAPAKYLEEICKRQAELAITYGLIAPILAISSLDIFCQVKDIYKLVVQVENQGFLPTYTSEKAKQNCLLTQIEVSLIIPENANLIAGKENQEIEHLEGRANKISGYVDSEIDYRTQIEWVIKAPSGTQITVEIKSERAGTISKSVILE